MAKEKLIYASAARRAILRSDPRLSYLIDNIKGVDAVEVVRCKDCKHRVQGFGDEYACGNPFYGMAAGVKLRDNDFCSYGERREGE